MTPKMLTTEELAEKLQIPVATLETMRSRPGRDPIPFVKIGRAIRYPEDKVQKWIERNTFYDANEAIDHKRER